MAQLGGDPADYWWLRPQPVQDPLPYMQLGARIAAEKRNDTMQMMQLQQNEKLLNIKLADEAYKSQVREQMSVGGAELSRVVADAYKSGDINSPSSQEAIYRVGAQYPYLMDTGAWQGVQRQMYQQEQLKINRARQVSLEDYRQRTASAAEVRADAAYLNTEEAAKLNVLKFQLQQELAASREDLDAARIGKIKAEIETIGERSDIAKQNLIARQKELQLRTEGLELRLPAIAKERLAAARSKYSASGYSSKPKENTEKYESEVNSILKPFEEKEKQAATSGAVGSKESPHKPATPEEAAKVPKGEYFMTPDGRLIQRQ